MVDRSFERHTRFFATASFSAFSFSASAIMPRREDDDLLFDAVDIQATAEVEV